MLPRPLQNFIDIFSHLPSLGPRQARRLAFHLLSLDEGTLGRVGKAVGELQKLDRCPRCFFVKEKEEKLCRICRNPKRDPRTIAIVMKETDLVSLESAGTFPGRYLILGESRIGELGTGQKLRLKHLASLIHKELGGKAAEIIVAVPPSSEGRLLMEELHPFIAPLAERVTRLAHGIPTGGEIEFADEETLKNALLGRR